MQNRVEPPILLSRLLTFVFAAMLVVLGVLGVTLYNMYPLDRPQVFFLMSTPRNDINVVLAELPLDDAYIDSFKRTFIREYIRARNEIVPDAREMRTKWGNDVDGVVYTWSTPEIYNAFAQTDMYNAWMGGVPDFDFSCSVEFDTKEAPAIEPRNTNEYAVTFQYFCADSNRQMPTKEYKIRIKLDMADDATIKWSDRLNNPLGVRVSEYVVESGNGDPLDTGYLATNAQ